MKLRKELVKKLNQKLGEGKWVIGNTGKEYQIRENNGMAIGRFILAEKTQKRLLESLSQFINYQN